MSDETAEPRRVRPRPETPALARLLRRPDLLERGPVVGRSLQSIEPAPVSLLEREAHLEPAPVRRAGVAPASLVAVDAEPVAQVRRAKRAPVCRPGPPLPEQDRPPDVR